MSSIDPDGKWIVFLDFKLAQMGIATGPALPNGNKIIPDFGFWHQLDRDRVGAPVYNRYANGECEFAEDFSAASARLFHHDSHVLFSHVAHNELRSPRDRRRARRRISERTAPPLGKPSAAIGLNRLLRTRCCRRFPRHEIVERLPGSVGDEFDDCSVVDETEKRRLVRN